MADRICLWCGTTIEHKRSNARYCCTQHQKNAGSRAHRARNPGYYAKYSKSPARLKYAEDNKEARRSYARDHYWKQDRAEIAKRTRAYRPTRNTFGSNVMNGDRYAATTRTASAYLSVTGSGYAAGTTTCALTAELSRRNSPWITSSHCPRVAETPSATFYRPARDATT
jgi:hypothetical protein